MPLQVSGTIPSWLHGDYVRNGPGTFKSMKHLFDGYGMIVKFSFKDGNVTTQQRCCVYVSLLHILHGLSNPQRALCVPCVC